VPYGRVVRRGGAYNRLAEPSWTNPLETAYSKTKGGRWNPPGSFGALYLNRDVRMARLQVEHKLAGQPYGVEDLDPTEQHDLVDVEVVQQDWLDCVTDGGLDAVGLPASYPLHPDGSPVDRGECQPIGQAAFDDHQPGVACRSAARGATADDEELAVFGREGDSDATMTGRRAFADWFWA
jgi:RES domain